MRESVFGKEHCLRPHFLQRSVESNSGSTTPTQTLIADAIDNGMASVDESPEALVQFVTEFGCYYDSYLATEPGRQNFWSRGQQGLISYVQRGKYVFVGGGPIAPTHHKVALLQEFLAFTEVRKWVVMFHCISEEDLPYFQHVGCQSTKLGEEAIIDLGDRHWVGKQFEWLRRQTNYCRRHGLVASEVDPQSISEQAWSALLAEILDVAAQTLSIKPQAEEMRFFEGQIDNHALGKRRLFVARDQQGTGRVEGFVVCNPMRGGKQWALELYRHRVDSVRGTVPFLFHHILNQFQEEGVDSVSLSLIPALRCETPIPGDSPWIRHGLNLTNKYLSPIFDLTGLAHFKSRFRPRYVERFVCAHPRAKLGAVLSFVNLFGILKLNYTKLVRILFEQLRKREARKTLSKLSSEQIHAHSAEVCPAHDESEIAAMNGQRTAASSNNDGSRAARQLVSRIGLDDNS